MTIIKPKSEPIWSSNIVKALIMGWARYKESFDIAVSEFWNMDIFVSDINLQNTMEIEVKVSKSDYQADYKKPKHNEPPITKYFYYAVPVDLKNYVLQDLEKRNSDYGLISFYDTPWQHWKNVKIVKYAKPRVVVNSRLTIREIVRRLSSELANNKIKLYVPKEKSTAEKNQ